MPARRRHKSPSFTPQLPTGAAPSAASGRNVESDVERFAALLKQSEQDAKQKAASARATREAVEREAKDKADHEAALAAARRDLERAIDDVKYSQRSGKKKAESDAAWRIAKARVLELETGERPAWAPVEATSAEPDDDAPADGENLESGPDDVAVDDETAAD